MRPDIPNIQKSCVRHLITVPEVMSAQGNANGNLEYSSIIVKRYLFLDEVAVGNGPLKSRLSLSMGWVALIKHSVSALTKRGFVSA